MIGLLSIKSLRENLETRLEKLIPGLRKAKSGGITSAAMDEVLIATRLLYPQLPVWENIEHPRDNYFSIHVLPLHLPLHSHLEEPIRELQKEMTADGVSLEFSKLHDLYEKRFSHVWMAEVQRWIYRPVGLCTFIYRDTSLRRNTDDSSIGGSAKENWWLYHAWLNLAQRNHRVLRGTVPYFEKWHPDFVLGRENAIVSKSLKDYPEHLQSKTGKSSR